MKLMLSFQWVVFKNNQSSLPYKHIVFECDFCTYLWAFVGRGIKWLCICSSHRKYLSPFFSCIVPYYVESCIFVIQILFSYILVSLKKDFTGNTMEYLELI